MQWTKGIIGGALLASVFLGGPQTGSASIRTPYDVLDQRADPDAEDAGLRRRTEPISIDEMIGPRTDDRGGRLRAHRFSEMCGTGVGITIYSSPAPPAHVVNPQVFALPPHVEATRWIQNVTGLSDGAVGNLLGVSRITARSWKDGGAIKVPHEQRLFATQDVLQRAMRQYPRLAEFRAWLNRPDPQEGVTPAEMLRTGQIDRARFLAIASPSTVAPMPSWARRAVPEAWQDALERPERSGEFADDVT